MGSDGFRWIQMGSDGFRCVQMGSDEFKWIQMDSDRLSIRGVKHFQQGFCSPSVFWVVSAPHWKFIVTIIAIVLIIVIMSKCFHFFYYTALHLCTALYVARTPQKCVHVCLSGPSIKSTAGWQNHDAQCQLGHLGAGVVRVGHGGSLRDERAGPALFLVLACHHQHHLTILVNVHNVHCTWAYLRLSPSLANLVLFHSIITIIIVIKGAP